MNPHEKLFSIWDFAEAAAREESPFAAASLGAALKRLAGEEAYKLMLVCEFKIAVAFEEPLK